MLDKTSTTPLYFVECDFGKQGNAFVELDRDTNSRANVISNIISGEYERVIRVLEVIENEGRCSDVSEDIAREICDRMIDDGTCALFFGGLYDFLEAQLGCEHMAALSRDLAAA